MEYSIQNIKLLRNGSAAASLEAAKTAIETYVEGKKATVNFDGVAIIGRYTLGEATKSVLGLVHQDSANKVTITYVDATGIEADVEANKKAIAKLNDDDKVEGSVKNTVKTAIEGLNVEDALTAGEVVVEVSESNGKISVKRAAVASSDKTVTVSADTATGAIDLAANIDGSTIIKDEKTGKLSVASSALVQYVGKEAVQISDVDTDNNNKTISLAINGNDKVLTQSTDGLLANISLHYTSGQTIELLGKANTEDKSTVISTIDVSDFIKDGMLYGTEVFTATATAQTITIKGQEHTFENLTIGNHYIAFVFKIDGKKVDYDWQVLDATNILHIYEAGNGLSLADDKHTFSVKIDANSEKFLTVSENGVKLSGVQDAIDTAKNDVLGTSDDTSADTTVYGAIAYAKAVEGKAISVKAGNGITVTENGTEKTIAANVKSGEALQNGTDGLYLNFSASTLDAGTF